MKHKKLNMRLKVAAKRQAEKDKIHRWSDDLRDLEAKVETERDTYGPPGEKVSEYLS